MHKVIISHGRTYIEFPFREKKEACEMYLKQAAHYAEECALLVDKCSVVLQGVDGRILAKIDMVATKIKRG